MSSGDDVALVTYMDFSEKDGQLLHHPSIKLRRSRIQLLSTSHSLLFHRCQDATTYKTNCFFFC